MLTALGIKSNSENVDCPIIHHPKFSGKSLFLDSFFRVRVASWKKMNGEFLDNYQKGLCDHFTSHRKLGMLDTVQFKFRTEYFVIGKKKL
jgi:hypothetical protein